MTSGTPAQVGSLPHEMVAWKAAAEDLAAQRDRLAHRVEQLEAALRETLDALCAADTSCERVHHSKVDQHSGTSCPVERRFSEIETRARALLSGVSP